ncbi:hypothetical protein LUZ60_002214 [Juncus effusus]|nr:hypothetical protein LUZ60_002214 [Juncus effusus]
MELTNNFKFFIFVSVICSSSLLCKGVAAGRIITSSSGSTFGRSREPRYNIEFHSSDSPFNPENGQESVFMNTKEGKSYKCYLPLVEEETRKVKSVNSQNSSNSVIESDRKIIKTPDELLDIMKDECFYMHEGWWSYELCYHKKLRQLHVEDEKVLQEFVLGEFDTEATLAFNEKNGDVNLLKDPRSKDASQRYHAHKYTNGTVCDLTDLPRETEVRFVCTGSGSQVLISSIKEISSCKYVLTVQAPMLCKHPMFQQERPTLNIHCIEIPAENENENEDSIEENQRATQITLVTEESETVPT